jgi:hypothetical protein
MCVVIYSYIHEWDTDKNTKFYIVHSLKYSVRLDANQTYMEVICYEKQLLLTRPITIIRICNRWMRAWDR